MRSVKANIFISLLLWLLIAACAWPAYVAANLGISFFQGEGSIIDAWLLEPKRKLLNEFINGYIQSAAIAALIGLVAVVDFQLFARHRLTGYIAGVLLPIACVVLAFLYFANPGSVVPGFAITGILLWFIYKFVDVGFRLRRVS